jgi:hypothetical protein
MTKLKSNRGTMTKLKLRNLAKKVINAKTFEQRAQILRAYAYRVGKVKQTNTWGYSFMKLSRVFAYYANNKDGNSQDLFSIFANANTKLKFVNFSALPEFTCPGAGKCLDWCYSFKAFRYPSAYCRMLQNTILLKERKTVIRNAWERLPSSIYVRLYVDGDFDSLSTMGFWFTMCNKRSDLSIWGYSKSFHLFRTWNQQGLQFPANYVLNLSSGSIFDDDKQMIKYMESLPITRGHFYAVDISGTYQKGFKRYADKAYHREVRDTLRDQTNQARVFSCTGFCHSCLPKDKPACAQIDFTTPIGIGNHG